MFSISQTNETVKFIFYTLSISEEMMTNPDAGRIATKTILNLSDVGILQRTKKILLSIRNESEITLSLDEFYSFSILIDFTSRCFISEIFSKRLKDIHEINPFDMQSTFEEMQSFYLPFATGYFNEIKELYKENKDVLEIIRVSTDWNMNDEQFSKE